MGALRLWGALRLRRASTTAVATAVAPVATAATVHRGWWWPTRRL